MIVASIKKGKDNYYINLEQNGDRFNYYVVYTSNQGVHILDKKQTINLFKDIFDSKMIFKEKYNNYDVYIDEIGNKRYFKNGKEDFFKLFINNGIETTMYKEDLQEKKQRFEFLRVMLKSNSIIGSITLASLVFYAALYPGSFEIVDWCAGKLESIEKGDLTLDEMNNYIINTNGVNLTDEEKEYFANNDLFNDVLDYSDASRYYILRRKLKDFNIRYFSEEEKKSKINLGGYYSLERINTINLKNDSKELFNYAAGHEFIHLLQDTNCYSYIREACAEIMQYEYYNQPIKTYIDQVNRVYKLMEIIGPIPVMECNFKGDTSTFENEIILNLGEDDGNRLLELFKTTLMNDDEQLKIVNEEIDSLLSKMYTNVYKSSMNDNSLFKYLDNEKIISGEYTRIYFNKNHELYNQPLNINYYEKIMIDIKELNDDDYTFLCTYKDKIDEKTYNELQGQKERVVYKNYKCIDGYSYNTIDHLFIKNDGEEVYTIEEAEDRNLYTDIEYINLRFNSYDTYKSVINNYYSCTVYSKKTNEIIGNLHKDEAGNDYVLVINSCEDKIEPISSKFSNSLHLK